MSDVTKNDATVDPSFDPVTSSSRDTTMDIASLLKSAKSSEAPVSEPKSPLQQAKENKENQTLGLVVENAELEANKPGQKVNKTEDDAMKEIDEYSAEQDRLIKVAQAVKVDKPTSPEQMVSLMDTLDTMSKDAATMAKIEASGDNVVPMRTIDYGPDKLEERTDKVMNPTAPAEDNHEDETLSEKEKDEKKQIVNILIDKTGLGGEFKFTEEEREKMFSSTEIRLKEVEDFDIHSVKILAPEKSFLESVNDYQFEGNTVPVVFPASRFRAYMKPLTYGELMDTALGNENLTFDKYHKQLSVIYNKMVNPTCGKFDSFEDFLRKFSFVDIPVALYGLAVATFPEVDDVPLQCNNPSCKNSFYHKYSPRTLIRFDQCHSKFLSAMKDTVECNMKDFDEFVKTSPTHTHKIMKLPMSGFLIEIGVASSYDYLYSIVENVLDEKFNERYPDDPNDILKSNTALISLIRAVYVPQGSDGYMKFDKFDDMIHAIYNVKPEEMTIIGNILQQYNEAYQVHFAFTNIRCPHCGAITENIPVDISDLVFLKRQRLLSTELNIETIPVI